MGKIDVLKKKIQLGSQVTLRLSKGEDVAGRITEIGDSYVCVDDGVTVFEEILVGWKIHDATLPLPPPEPPPPKPPPDPLPQYSAQVVERRAQIEAALSEHVKWAELKVPDPDFHFPDEEFSDSVIEEIRREWNKAKDKYEYAVKVNEYYRLNDIIAHILQPLLNRIPDNAAIQYLTGCIFQKANRLSESVNCFKKAALISNSPKHWQAFAASTPTGSALRCYALRRVLLKEPPKKQSDWWYVYIGLALQYGDIAELCEALSRWPETHEKDHVQLFAEAVIFLFSRLEQKEASLKVTTSLIDGDISRVLSKENLELLRKSASPASAEIQEAEKEITTTRSIPDRVLIQKPPNPSAGILRGKLSSFGSQGYGFIKTEDAEIFFFRIDDVTDELLKQDLIDGGWRMLPEVEFEEIPAPGHQYPRAVRVRRIQSVGELIKQAEQMLRIKQHSQAMGLVRRVLAIDDNHDKAKQLESEILWQIKTQGIGLPKGNGPYAKAKRAQFIDDDTQSAIKFFRQAIEKKDNQESAVKDLASLLQEQAKVSGSADFLSQAIKLLEEHRKKFSGPSPYDNNLVTMYQHTGRHTEAISMLNQLVAKAPKQSRPTIYRRIASSHFKSGNFDEAEKILRKILAEVPDDRLSQSWLARLEEARITGSYDEAEELFEASGGLAEEGVSLSPLAREAIDSCNYTGVDRSLLQSGEFKEKHVQQLEDLAKELGTKRPLDRAAYYLTASAILDRPSFAEETSRKYDYLRRYFVSLGDAAWQDKKPADVVRTYYLESLGLAFEYSDEAWKTLLRYLVTYCINDFTEFDTWVPTHSHEKYVDKVRHYEKCLIKVLASRRDPKDWLLPLLDLSSVSTFASRSIRIAVDKNSAIRGLISQLVEKGDDASLAPAIQEAWQRLIREHLHYNERMRMECHFYTELQLTLASLEDFVRWLAASLQKPLCELDRRRVRKLSGICQEAIEFCRSTDFEDKERYYWLVTTSSEKLAREIFDLPTQLSFESLQSLAKHIHSLTEEEYAQITASSSADLKTQLLTESYILGPNDEIRLQVQVTNRDGCSPASKVRLLIGPEDSEYFTVNGASQQLLDSLRGGGEEVEHLVISPTMLAKRDRAFPVAIRATYQDRVGEERITPESQFTVRLYDESEFQEIPNRYAPYADGGPIPIDDPDMFKGRDELLSRLERTLLESTGGKCFVMFGQMRTGKSSLLEHLGHRLQIRNDCVTVSFSIQDLAPDISETAFYYWILSLTQEAIAKFYQDKGIAITVESISIDQLSIHPTLQFHESMNRLCQKLQKIESVNPRLVLLIDEFTDIYKQIRKGKIKPEFMKAWKRIIEKRYFSSVLVGQDVMPSFKIDFANEFGVTEDVRVTYLSEAYAMKLIEEPIGSKQFVGKAISRIIELTAGSPFYTMMFCSRLVDYINVTRSVIITEADIIAVKENMLTGDRKLVTGDRRLTRDKFDNLIKAGDGYEDSGIDPAATFSICKAIARHAEKGWCLKDALKEKFDNNLDELLSDLERREVLEQKNNTYRIRVGLFHEWLLTQG